MRASPPCSLARIRSKRSSTRGMKADRERAPPREARRRCRRARARPAARRPCGLRATSGSGARRRQTLASQQPLDQILRGGAARAREESDVGTREITHAANAPRVAGRHDQPRLPAREVEDQHRPPRQPALDEGDVEVARVLVVEVRARDVHLAVREQIQRRAARPVEPDDAIAGARGAGARGEDSAGRRAACAQQRVARTHRDSRTASRAPAPPRGTPPDERAVGRRSPARPDRRRSGGGRPSGHRLRRAPRARRPARALARRAGSSFLPTGLDVIGRQLHAHRRVPLVDPEQILDAAPELARQAQRQRRRRDAVPRLERAQALAADAGSRREILLAQPRRRPPSPDAVS